MSQVVISSACIGATTFLQDALFELAKSNPAKAEALAAVPLKEVIEECVQKAVIALLARHPNITRADGPQDYYKRTQSAVNGLSVLAALRSATFERGVGICLDADGTVRFAADAYGGYTGESERIQSLFKEYFEAELTQAAYEIMGYKIEEKSVQTLGDGSIAFDFRCTKAGA